MSMDLPANLRDELMDIRANARRNPNIQVNREIIADYAKAIARYDLAVAELADAEKYLISSYKAYMGIETEN